MYLQGLLQGLEFLAIQLGVLDQKKYSYRFKSNNEYFHKSSQQIFRKETMQLAFKRMVMKTMNNQVVLVEKEYALSGAKLIQQF